jgi:hypothetical protein
MICHQQQYYFDLTKCMPTKADGDIVFMFHTGHQIWIGVPVFLIIKKEEFFKSYYSHWMQMPKAPSTTDAHAFLE